MMSMTPLTAGDQTRADDLVEVRIAKGPIRRSIILWHEARVLRVHAPRQGERFARVTIEMHINGFLQEIREIHPGALRKRAPATLHVTHRAPAAP